MPRCVHRYDDGRPCERIVGAAQGYCYSHDPERAEERSRNASKAARSKPNRELVGVKAQLQDLTRDVLSGDLETGRAAVANQLINTRLRAIEQERKNRETEDLEARIEALERASEAKKGAGRWHGGA